MEIIQEIKCMKPKYDDVIRLTHEKDHKRIHEHSKKEHLNYSESYFLNKNIKVTFRVLIQWYKSLITFNIYLSKPSQQIYLYVMRVQSKEINIQMILLQKLFINSKSI
ncbi:unnamed protein product [Paramecium octaurelia]|uniref:Uncharacterized protein n=1 Tax=Paramecium octaurelia TaxID=43137 RepID=A0A8S1T7N3_PAROT|nr:unnamed protein product [Paramecium octaurelia]